MSALDVGRGAKVCMRCPNEHSGQMAASINEWAVAC